MNAGRLALTSEIAALHTPTGRVLVRTPEPDAVVGLLNGQVVDRRGDTVTVRGIEPAALNARLVGSGVRVTGLTEERRTLEQVVLELTGSGTDRMDRT
jgi:ABC-2 type transport system ATP-binding protein